jgi:putative membrane protein
MGGGFVAELTTSTRNQRLMNIVLWSIAVAYVGGSLFNAIFPNVMIFISLVLLLFPFVLIHGAKRDGWKGMAVFVVITLIVSGILENLSILTGFPFGHYYYTDALGPKVALVPLFIAPSYVSFGYLSWVLATVIVNEVHRKSTLFITIAVPLVASFMMVAWDLSLDPRAATIGNNWIWTQGGGYFGVPISNFLGWSLTVYVFYQLFALYLRQRGSENLSRTLPTTHYLQAILVYLWTGVAFVLSFLFRGANVQVTDAVGHVWQTADIYEATALSAIYTMIFISILALVILFRDPLTQKKVEVSVSPGSVDLQRLS